MSETPDHNDRTAPDLDVLLREWHDVNAERAADGRDLLVQRLAEARRAERAKAAEADRPGPFMLLGLFIRRLAANRYTPALASLTFLVVIVALLVPRPGGTAHAAVAMVAEGGRLDARDDEGNLLGACPLTHTDVDVRVSGFMSRVDVTQTYVNPYDRKIEAVYTFPLSHRAAIDRMTITVGDRVVVGEVKERELARQIYEAARAQGYVAGLLEQERPNIFTQSVANLEPEAEVVVRISYVEMLAARDGRYLFDFPMVVGPRYIPGAPTTSPSPVPAELQPRAGLILLGPARLLVGAAGDTTPGTLQPGKLTGLIAAAQPVRYPGDAWWGRGDVTGGAGGPRLWYRFEAAYADGSREFGELYTDGTGQLNGRWFYADPSAIAGMGTGFARDTDRVPDASRITPMPARPGTRAGHDVSVTVTIDGGGPGVLDVTSELHEIETAGRDFRADGAPAGVTVTLADRKTIPNRDFVLSWRQTSDTITEATFAHTTDAAGDWSGGFFSMILQPPDRVTDAQVPPRELIFVMDTSGSMRGFPLEKSKAVMTRAIAAMRPNDTFNVITFAGHTAVLWEQPKSATPANVAEAQAFVVSRQSGGGTEMLKAIDAALAPSPGPLPPRTLLDLPADDRAVELAVPYGDVHVTGDPGVFRIPVPGGLEVRLQSEGDLPPVLSPHGVTLSFAGTWRTVDGRRVLVAERVSMDGTPVAAPPLRLVFFLTDGYVGNEAEILAAVYRHAGTTRVFPFGIGNSVNRFLLDSMAIVGRGAAEFVLLGSDADEAVERFTRRIETPVLTDITLEFSDGLQVTDLLPAPALPDLFDVEPLVIHGRYTEAGRGTVTIRGRTGAGPYERVVELELPETAPEHDVIATLWARAQVDHVMPPHLDHAGVAGTPQDVKDRVVALGEQFSIMTPLTSFVAVEKSRLTIDGEPVLVAVPLELPDGVAWEGIFGDGESSAIPGDAPKLGAAGAVRGAEPGTRRLLSGSVRTNTSASLPGRRGKRSAPGKGGADGFGGGSAVAGEPVDTSAAGFRGTDASQITETRSRAAAPPPAPTAPKPQAPSRIQQKKDAPASAPEPLRKAEAREALRETEADAERPAAGLIMERVLTNGAVEDADIVIAAGPEGERNERADDAFGFAAPQEPAVADQLEYWQDTAQEEAAPTEEQTERQAAQLGRVLHPALLQQRTARDGRTAGEDRRSPAPPVLVTVLLGEVGDDAARAALAKAGLAIKAWSKSLPIVVGLVALEDLEKLALVPGVRRVEPTRMTPAG